MSAVRRAGALLLLALAACGEPAPGTVVGDVFLAEDVTYEVNLTGLPVHLLEETEEVDSALARLCPEEVGISQEEAWRERARLLAARVVRTDTTDAGARFAMDSVPPGRYLLWADTTVDATRWSWLHPVRVPAGDTVRGNLTNANPDENPFRCGR